MPSSTRFSSRLQNDSFAILISRIHKWFHDWSIVNSMAIFITNSSTNTIAFFIKIHCAPYRCFICCIIDIIDIVVLLLYFCNQTRGSCRYIRIAIHNEILTKVVRSTCRVFVCSSNNIVYVSITRFLSFVCIADPKNRVSFDKPFCVCVVVTIHMRQSKIFVLGLSSIVKYFERRTRWKRFCDVTTNVRNTRNFICVQEEPICSSFFDMLNPVDDPILSMNFVTSFRRIYYCDYPFFVGVLVDHAINVSQSDVDTGFGGENHRIYSI
mmetsp:Transcript_6476/g.7345  ORF Transcript_6476/g.7345 Transcript_6476/m.7345 type:complete len:267 (+) Transcript_6476:437-1237(+)